jgi:iron complex transport system ATP-binding protein
MRRIKEGGRREGRREEDVALIATRVSYVYRRRLGGGDVHALCDVTVAIPRGSLTGFIGPNGCGKSTLLKVLAGVLAPTAGRVTLDGDDLGMLPRRVVARRIALVPQETHPAFDYTVMEMVLMGRHPHLGLFALEGPVDFAMAHDALEATGAQHLADRQYMTLSGGEKQRVLIAAALAQAPEILLLDEPTAALDLGYQLEVAALLLRLNRERGVTIALATHDLNLAASLCGTLTLLHSGRVLAEGRTGDVLTPDAVERLYGVEADVAFHDRAGHLTVLPIGRRR